MRAGFVYDADTQHLHREIKSDCKRSRGQIVLSYNGDVVAQDNAVSTPAF